MRGETGKRAVTLLVVVAMVTSTFTTAAVAAAAGTGGGSTAADLGGTTALADVPGPVPPATDQFAVRQGGSCTVVQPLGDGSQTVEEFYNYQINGSGVLYGSAGTRDLQQNQASQLFLYRGSDGISLVLLHDAVNGSYGGTVEMSFTGLPENGSWVVQDDDYYDRDDRFNKNGSDGSASWVWERNRNDGGAISGFGQSFERVTIDPAFNEESSRYPYSDWQTTDENNQITEWFYRTGDGGTGTLDMGQSVTIEPGNCDESAPTADLSVSTTNVSAGESVTFDAGGSSDDRSLVEYQWDFDGDDEVDETTDDPTVTHTYNQSGEFTPAVAVYDGGRNADVATAGPITVNQATQQVTDCRVIDSPGTYTLANDVSSSSSGACISITSSNVTFDGNGNTVTDAGGDGRSVGVGVASGASNVVVRNVNAEGWTVGVEVADTQNVRVTGITATDNLYGTYTVSSSNVTITDSRAVNNGDIGFAHTGATNVVHRGTTAVGNTWGFHFEEASTDATLTDVTSVDNEWAYYHYPGSGNRYFGPLNHQVVNMTAGDDINFGFTGGSGAAFTESSASTTPENLTGTGDHLVYAPVIQDPVLNTFSMSYSDDEITGIDESSLQMWQYVWNEDGARSNGEWQQVDATLDTDTNTLTASNLDPVESNQYLFALFGEGTGEQPAPTDEAPTAAIDAPTTVSANETLSLSAAGSSDDGTIESYEWELGNGETASGETVEHTYTETGNYTVTLTVTDDAGNANTTSTTITVETNATQIPPTAAIDAPTDAVVNESLSFSASGSTDNGEIASYEWEFGDGATATGETVEHAYTETGEYEVTLTVTDADGNTNATTQTIEVEEPNTPPNATFALASTVAANESVTLDASVSSDEDGIIAYRWDFDGDGAIDAVTDDPTVDHAFTTIGDVTVTLTVVDGSGTTATATRTVSVGDADAPSAAVTAPSEAMAGTDVVLSATGSTDNVGIASYQWQFGDGATATGATVQHTYEEPGTYTVELVVTDVAGGTDMASAEITVTEGDANATPPTASLDLPESTPVDESVTLDASGSSDEGGIAEYRWDFDGDGEVDETTAEPTVDHTFTQAGNVTAVVTVVDANGSTASAIDTIEVVDDDAPVAVIDGSTTVTAGETLSLTAANSSDDGTIESYEWQFGDDATATGESVDHTYGSAGTYTVTLTVTDDAGNTDTATREVTVEAASGSDDGGSGGNGGAPGGGGDDDDDDDGGNGGAPSGGGDDDDDDDGGSGAPGGSGDDDNDDPGSSDSDSGDSDSGDDEETETPTDTPTATPQPAEISVTALEANRTNIESGQSIEFVATVENTGGEAGNYTVELELFGETVAQQTVEVAGGETATVSFVQTIDAAGSYTARVDDRTVSVSVGEAAAGGQTGTANVTETSTPGFGPIVAVLALIALAGVAMRRTNE